MGGKGLTSSKMYYLQMWKSDELENGEAIPRDDFRFVVISQHGPKEYAKELGESALNLENFYPLVVETGE